MINISSVVTELLNTDEVAMAAISRGLLNLSSYAREIQPRVEEQAFKPVGVKSIVVSLSRLAKKYEGSESQERPHLATISVHSNLQVFTFEKTIENSKNLEKVFAKARDFNGFFTTTSGMTELAIITENSIMNSIREEIDFGKPIFFSRNLVGVTVKLKRSYLQIPNIILQITRQLAVKKINIVEIVSTATELTYVINRKDSDMALAQLSKLLG